MNASRDDMDKFAEKELTIKYDWLTNYIPETRKYSGLKLAVFLKPRIIVNQNVHKVSIVVERNQGNYKYKKNQKAT